jgi:hypothetical protein
LFFSLYTSLKIRAVTQAIAAFFALSKEKITMLNLGRLFSTNSLMKEAHYFLKSSGLQNLLTLKLIKTKVG